MKSFDAFGWVRFIEVMEQNMETTILCIKVIWFILG